jgi:hypothetical protein
MDRGVYKYLIEKLRPEIGADAGSLPLHFVRSGVEATPEAFESLEFFIRTVIPGGDNQQNIEVPLLHAAGGSFFSCLFRHAHTALADFLHEGSTSSSQNFRSNGIQLTRFLTFCARDEGALFLRQPDPVDCAMLCFLTEGMMHAGWCQNAFEGVGKLAAHSYFLNTRKSLFRAVPRDFGVVCAYLWGAWLLARKTEGIRTVNQPYSPCGNETFNWNFQQSGPKSYIAIKSGIPGLSYLLSKSPSLPCHPFACLMNDGLAGLKLYVNKHAIQAVSLKDFSEINRVKIHGHKFIYECQTGLIAGMNAGITWTVVILTYENTMYRIDMVNFPQPTGISAVSAEMRLETGTKTEPNGMNSFIGKGFENTVVRFLESPFTFAFDRTEENGISVYSASGSHEAGALKFITAWATGRGISAINETKLLGIFDSE